MRKTISMHQERDNKHANDDAVPKGAVPAYLLDREGVSRAKVLSNTVKQKRKEVRCCTCSPNRRSPRLAAGGTGCPGVGQQLLELSARPRHDSQRSATSSTTR